MKDEKRFLVDVGMRDLPFPIKALSKVQPEGQSTIVRISIQARIMHEFEAQWIDKFIKMAHKHRERIGTKFLRDNIGEYLTELKAAYIKIDFTYPFFVEKTTPVSKEKCLVKYNCTYSAKVPSLDDKPRIFFKMEIPCITTYPGSSTEKLGGLFGQLSFVTIEIVSQKDIYPEDLVELVDRHAVAPVYSFLTAEDQLHVIKRIHSENKTSVVMIDELKDELAADKTIDFYSIICANFGLLHSYSTVIGTEKSMWLPFSGFEGYDI